VHLYYRPIYRVLRSTRYTTMRSSFLSILAVLGLSTSAAFADVICDPKHEIQVGRTAATAHFVEVIKGCIEHICIGQVENFVAKHCGSVLLTVTGTEASLPSPSTMSHHRGRSRCDYIDRACPVRGACDEWERWCSRTKCFWRRQQEVKS
jgi:hypothetical protein